MKKVLILISFFILTSCENLDDSLIKRAVNDGFGTPISETAIQLCYKNRLYRVQLNRKHLYPERIIPILKDPNNPNSTELLKCNNSIEIKKNNE